MRSFDFMINLLSITISLMVHPFHVSVSDINYKEDQKTLQISTRIFLDDLELALRTYTGSENLDITDENNWIFVNENLKLYLLEHIKLWNGKGSEYEINYVGAEIEDNVMWTYLEIKKIKKLRRVKVYNSVLHEVWGDQENLVHFRAFDDVWSARLYKYSDVAVFEWD